MPNAITEKQVVGIWQDILLERTGLKTVDNEPVSVIYPGRRNDDRGADFKDAIVNTRQGKSRGDIEIHVKTSDWRTHQHHLDPAYNQVILHVVYQHDTTEPITLENGFTAPTLALNEHTGNNNDFRRVSAIPCRRPGYGDKALLIANRLDEAGEIRFLKHAAIYEKMILACGAGQALYQGIITALGYSKNKDAMAELSRRLPLDRLEALISVKMSDDEYLARCQSNLLGAAGLLPSQRIEQRPASDDMENWETTLENIWATVSRIERMSLNDWHFFKVRPSNYPVRRIAAMSYLLQRYRKTGLLVGLLEKIKEADSLEKALWVPPEGYWGCYLDFGIPSQCAAPALLGKERVADIIVNVVLPFFYIRESSGSGERVLEIYRGYRALEENTLVKHMRQQLGITRFLVNTARRQQGLIHIYKTQCLEGNCKECMLV